MLLDQQCIDNYCLERITRRKNRDPRHQTFVMMILQGKEFTIFQPAQEYLPSIEKVILLIFA